MSALPKIFAALGLLVCAVLLLRQALPAARRARFDALAIALGRLLRHLPQALRRQRHQQRASREARAAIERARRQRGQRAPGAGPAEVHDLASHRRKRKAADPAQDTAPRRDDGPGEPPPPTLH